MDSEPRLNAPERLRYSQAVRRYVRDECEDALAEAGDVGRALMQKQVAPEELAEIHEAALRALACELPALPLGDTVSRISAPLSEMLMAYGLAFREQAARRQAMECRLRQAQKMETMGTFAAGIAHDFNNIMGTIIGFAELSLDDVAPESLARQNLQQVLRAAARARDLVARILAFSRRDAPRHAPVPFAAIVGEALHFLEASMPPAVRLRTRIDARGWIEADAVQIHQVVINLCANAIHAIGGSGVLEVALEDIDTRAMPTAPPLRSIPGEYVRLTVQDSGSGMSRDVLERIFEPFYTTKPVGQGTGLGLSVVYGVVQGCGGTLSVTSEPGQGSRFEVYLPRLRSRGDAATVFVTGPEQASAPQGSGDREASDLAHADEGPPAGALLPLGDDEE